MIFTSSPQCANSTMFNSGHLSTLMECDDVTTFSECGWFCILGYKGKNRHCYYHAHKPKDFTNALLMRNMVYTGRTVREMTDAEKEKMREERSVMMMKGFGY